METRYRVVLFHCFAHCRGEGDSDFQCTHPFVDIEGAKERFDFCTPRARG